jgi:L-ascorbate metabolism protein UlaG (beta-lactamase superfamily)
MTHLRLGSSPAALRPGPRIGTLRRLGLRLALAGLLALLAGAGAVRAADALTGDRIPTLQGDLVLHPINHATLALQWNGLTLCVDPVGGAGRFADLPRPDLILLTDVHGDHLDAATLKALVGEKTRLVAPPAAAGQLPAEWRSRITELANGQTNTVLGVAIEAIPAYNLSADRQKFHARGRGNGYVLTLGGKRVYLSGDTEDIPEMRALKAIDVAFVCMNLPYTMTVEQAAGAVRAFKPKVVYPYHYRGSDLEAFKRLVSEDPGIEVRLRDWYQP